MMQQRRVRTADWVTGLVLAAVGLAGCGSSVAPATGPGTDRALGTVTLSLVWPAAVGGRLVPTVSQSVRFELLPLAHPDLGQTALLVRPATEVTFSKLPLGRATLRATAYPTADGSGTPLAAATKAFTVTGGGATTKVSLTMASTVAHFGITVEPAALWVGHTVTATATATDAAGQVVLLPDTVAWSVVSGSACVALPAAPGAGHSVTVTGKAAGVAVLQASVEEAPGVPRRATTELSVAPLPPLLFTDFASATGLNFQGAAAATQGVLRVMPATTWNVGSAWYTTKQSVSRGFQSQFQFRIGGGGSYQADGFAFVIQNSSSTALGSYAEGLGYGSYYGGTAIANSLAVEFDIYQNSGEDDPNANHISIHTRGTDDNSASEAYSLGSVTSPVSLADGAIHTARVVYLPGTLAVYLDGSVNAVLSVPYRFETGGSYGSGVAPGLSLDAGRAWVGFTGSTGTYYADHDILNWWLQPSP